MSTRVFTLLMCSCLLLLDCCEVVRFFVSSASDAFFVRLMEHFPISLIHVPYVYVQTLYVHFTLFQT